MSDDLYDRIYGAVTSPALLCRCPNCVTKAVMAVVQPALDSTPSDPPAALGGAAGAQGDPAGMLGRCPAGSPAPREGGEER